MSPNSDRFSTPRGSARILGRLLILALVVLATEGGCNAKEEDFFRRLSGILGGGPIPGSINTSVTVDGSPASGVAVTIQRGGTTVATGTTGSGGSFATPQNLDPGTYTVSITPALGVTCPTPPGTQQTVTVVSAQTAQVSFACTTPPTTGTITGRVVVADQPRQGAGVSAGGRSATSGANGSFTITEVPTGQQMVSTSLTGHVCEVKTANVMAGQTADVGDVDCSPLAGTVSGQVTVNGVGESGVAVRLLEGTTEIATTTTGTGGNYQFTNVAPGTKTVAITPPAGTTFPTTQQDVTVPAGGTATANFAGTRPTGDFTVSLANPAPGWNHDMPGVSSLECKVISTNPPQPGATFSATTTGPTEGGASGVVTPQPVTGTLDANGRAELRVRINRFGTYVNTVTVTSGGNQRSATAQVTVTSAANTCPSAAAPSSQRFKRGIVGLLPDNVTILGLRPVAFHYVQPYGNPTVPQIGLIAEEVLRVYPEAVALDANGRPEGIYYGVLTGRVIAQLEARASQALDAGVARLAEALE